MAWRFPRFDGQIRRVDLAPLVTSDCAIACVDPVVADRRPASAADTCNADPDFGVCNRVAKHKYIAQIRSPADIDAIAIGAFDYVVRDKAVCLD